MTDPYEVLGLPADSSDEAVRHRYLDLVKQFPPARYPERFAAIRAAYEGLRDRETRLRLQVFRRGTTDSVETILEEVRCPSSRPRVSLRTLLGLVRRG